MPTMKEAASNFLAKKIIAVAGVSRTQNKAANLIYRKLRSEGYKVYAVNPNATTVAGDDCYPNLAAIPEKPEGVVIVTKPEITELLVKECSELGIKNLWMHRGPDTKSSSVSSAAVDYCHQHGIAVIPGGCPMMYISHADLGHRFMRWMQNLSGSLPKKL
jgi:uncharacterized protein